MEFSGYTIIWDWEGTKRHAKRNDSILEYNIVMENLILKFYG